MRCVLAFILAVAAPGGTPVVVEIGASAELEVGNAIGWFCDDPWLVDATLVTRDGLNYWIVTGVAQGRTECRVGTDPSRHTAVFDVTVTPPNSPL